MTNVNKLFLIACLAGLSFNSMACQKLSTGKEGSDKEGTGKEGSDKHGERRKGPPNFAVLDTDNDAQISLEEFSQHKLPHGDPSKVFSRIDINQDGYISESELIPVFISI